MKKRRQRAPGQYADELMQEWWGPEYGAAIQGNN